MVQQYRSVETEPQPCMGFFCVTFVPWGVERRASSTKEVVEFFFPPFPTVEACFKQGDASFFTFISVHKMRRCSRMETHLFNFREDCQLFLQMCLLRELLSKGC